VLAVFLLASAGAERRRPHRHGELPDREAALATASFAPPRGRARPAPSSH